MPTIKLKIKNHTYTWSGTNKSGKKLTGEITTISINLAKYKLTQQGITHHSIQKKRSPTHPKKITYKDITLFFRQFSTLITANIPIIQACEILIKGQAPTPLRHIILTIKNALESGKNLADALRNHPLYFDPLTCHLIQIGEQTGKIDTMLLHVSQMKESSLALKNKVKQALLYPIIVLVVALIISLGMLVFIVPKFEELFQNFHGKLPSFTLAVINISNIIRHHFIFLFIPVIVIFIFFKYYKYSIPLKRKIDQTLLKFPLLGTLLQKYLLAKFAYSLATLFSAGIPVTEALKMMSQLSHNYRYQSSINKLQSQITTGQQLHIAMQTNHFFPSLMTQMVKVGEESGTLNYMLTKVAEFYENDLNHLSHHFSQLLEPLIIIILGVLIGGLVIALYLPIFKLGTVI